MIRPAEVQKVVAEMKDSLTVAFSSCRLLILSVEDMLALPRLKMGKFTKNIARGDIRAVVEETTQILSFKSSELGVGVRTSYSGFEDGDFKVLLDLQRFQQVAINYLSNALKFVPSSKNVLVLTHLVKGHADGDLHDGEGETQLRHFRS